MHCARSRCARGFRSSARGNSLHSALLQMQKHPNLRSGRSRKISPGPILKRRSRPGARTTGAFSAVTNLSLATLCNRSVALWHCASGNWGYSQGGEPMNLDQVLLDFGKKSAKGAFPNIDRADVVAGLRKRISPGGAQNIDQGASSLCGPAAVMFCVASRNPEMYVQYVTDLYDQGQAKFGTLPVTPSPLCRNYSPKMDAADWIALASLRDSDNKILNY